MGGTALGASGRSNNGLKLDVKTGKLSLWRLFPAFKLLEFLRGGTARAPASKRQRLTADATATGSGAPTGDASDATEDAA